MSLNLVSEQLLSANGLNHQDLFAILGQLTERRLGEGPVGQMGRIKSAAEHGHAARRRRCAQSQSLRTRNSRVRRASRESSGSIRL